MKKSRDKLTGAERLGLLFGKGLPGSAGDPPIVFVDDFLVPLSVLNVDMLHFHSALAFLIDGNCFDGIVLLVLLVLLLLFHSM